jgi:hypothetical protein
MTPQEFKAWFDGFTESLDNTPNEKQWKRIKERVAEIDGKPITEQVFIDRWWPQWHYHSMLPCYSPNPLHWPTVVCNTGGVQLSNNVSMLADGGSFDSCVAMNALGRAESIGIA